MKTKSKLEKNFPCLKCITTSQVFCFVLMADLWFQNLTLKLIGCRTKILDITFVTSDQINYALRFTMKVLSDRIAPACTSAGKWSNSTKKFSQRSHFPLHLKQPCLSV